jgi:hypothetical protein
MYIGHHSNLRIVIHIKPFDRFIAVLYVSFFRALKCSHISEHECRLWKLFQTPNVIDRETEGKISCSSPFNAGRLPALLPLNPTAHKGIRSLPAMRG